DPVGREVASARVNAIRAALASFEGDESPAAAALREEYNALFGSAAAEPADGETDRTAPTPHDRIRRRALAAARHVVLEMRGHDEIGDDAFHLVEEELDWLEMSGMAREEADRGTS